MRCFKDLGIGDTASADEVKAAWRALASKHHPDREGGDAAEFMRLRKSYDEALAVATAPKECGTCKGSGSVNHQNGWVSIKVICPECRGTGEQT